MMEQFRDVTYWVAAILGIGVSWGHSQRRIKQAEQANHETAKLLKEHVQEQKANGLVTLSSHDRMQRDCQKLWMSELGHLRELAAAQISENKEIRQELRAMRQQITESGATKT